MTITELIDWLSEIAETNPDAEVHLAIQPSYPLAVDIAAITLLPAEDGAPAPEETGIVWIAATDSVSEKLNPYAPRAAWDGEHTSDVYPYWQDR